MCSHYKSSGPLASCLLLNVYVFNQARAVPQQLNKPSPTVCSVSLCPRIKGLHQSLVCFVHHGSPNVCPYVIDARFLASLCTKNNPFPFVWVVFYKEVTPHLILDPGPNKTSQAVHRLACCDPIKATPQGNKTNHLWLHIKQVMLPSCFVGVIPTVDHVLNPLGKLWESCSHQPLSILGITLTLPSLGLFRV